MTGILGRRLRLPPPSPLEEEDRDGRQEEKEEEAAAGHRIVRPLQRHVDQRLRIARIGWVVTSWDGRPDRVAGRVVRRHEHVAVTGGDSDPQIVARRVVVGLVIVPDDLGLDQRAGVSERDVVDLVPQKNAERPQAQPRVARTPAQNATVWSMPSSACVTRRLSNEPAACPSMCPRRGRHHDPPRPR